MKCCRSEAAAHPIPCNVPGKVSVQVQSLTLLITCEGEQSQTGGIE